MVLLVVLLLVVIHLMLVVEVAQEIILDTLQQVEGELLGGQIPAVAVAVLKD
jgi:hypothetical protein